MNEEPGELLQQSWLILFELFEKKPELVSEPVGALVNYLKLHIYGQLRLFCDRAFLCPTVVTRKKHREAGKEVSYGFVEAAPGLGEDRQLYAESYQVPVTPRGEKAARKMLRNLKTCKGEKFISSCMTKGRANNCRYYRVTIYCNDIAATMYKVPSKEDAIRYRDEFVQRMIEHIEGALEDGYATLA